MKITEHLLVVKILLLLLGVWPANMIKVHPLIATIYSKYFLAAWSFLAIFEISQYIQLVLLIIGGQNAEEIVENLSVSILYTLNLYKILCCRTRNVFSLFSLISENKKKVLATNDEVVVNIYKKHAIQAYVSSIVHVGMATFCIFLYIIYPLYTNKTQNLVGDNAKFIFSSWFPFNKTEHFTLVYVLHVVAGYYGSAYAVYSDAAFFSIMIYCVGQMKILQHYLSNIYKYSIDYQKINNCNLDEAQICVVKKFIVMHQDIIS